MAAEIRKRLPGVGTKKLHKLLYYVQGHHMATFGEPLFSETISAWDMGPVVGQLWNAERTGSAALTEPAQPDEAALNSIGYVLARYGGLSGHDLERLTHSERPWQDADAKRRELRQRSYPIDVQRLGSYFKTEAPDDDLSVMPAQAEVTSWLAGFAARGHPARSVDSKESLGARRR